MNNLLAMSSLDPDIANFLQIDAQRLLSIGRAAWRWQQAREHGGPLDAASVALDDALRQHATVLGSGAGQP